MTGDGRRGSPLDLSTPQAQRGRFPLTFLILWMATAGSFAGRDAVVNVDPSLLVAVVEVNYYTLFPTVALAMLIVYDSSEDCDAIAFDVMLTSVWFWWKFAR